MKESRMIPAQSCQVEETVTVIMTIVTQVDFQGFIGDILAISDETNAWTGEADQGWFVKNIVLKLT